MLLKSIKENKLYALFLLIIGVCFYFLNVYTPVYSDDFHYCFIFETTTPISSLGDIFVSQYRHYFEFNGRVVPHVLVQLFDGILGKGVFNVANAVVFVLFLHLLTTTITKDRSQYYRALTISLICIFFAIPYFFYVFLWLSGAFNYLWTATILLFFNQQLLKDKRPSKWQYPLLVIAGLLCGWTHEGFVFAMMAGYFVYYLRNRRELTPYRIALLIGFFVGAVLLISPGSLHRVPYNDVSIGPSMFAAIKSIASVLLDLKNIGIFYLLIASLIVLSICRKDLCKSVVRENATWLICAAVSTVFIAIISKYFFGSHALFIVEFFSLIVFVKVLLYIKIPQIICTCCNIAVCVYVMFAVSVCKVTNDGFKQIEKQLQDKSAFIIKSPIFPTSSLFDKFTKHVTSGNTYLVIDNGVTMMANYYHRGRFVLLPEEFLNDIKDHPEHYQEFYTRQSWPIYAKRISGDKKIKYVTYLLRDTQPEEIPFYLRPMASKIERYAKPETEPLEFCVVPDGNDALLIVRKYRLEEVRSRVKAIKVVYE